MTRQNGPKGSRRARVTMASLLAGTVLAGGIVGWSVVDGATAAVSPQSEITVSGPQAGFADLAVQVKPAVVNITTSKEAQQAGSGAMPNLPPGSPFGDMFRRFQQQRPDVPMQGQGSGFIIDPEGYIVTNNHVIDDADEITVTMDDGSTHTAAVVGQDPKTDLALIKIETDEALPFVTFGDSDQARIGDWVVAVGNPFGLGGTVTAGIISAHGRDIKAGPYDDFLQIDAPINPGNSGGPLFNQTGQVIGVDTAIFSPSGGNVGIGFAVPANIASKVVAQLREHGSVERGWLGVQMQAMTEPLAKAMDRKDTDGVIVAQVLEDSPAAGSELQQGDIITAFEGKPIEEPRDLAVAVADARAGQTGKLTVWRDGKEMQLDVTIGKQPQEETVAMNEPSTDEPVGLQLAPLSDPARSELGLEPDVEGAVVAQVMPNSRAAESGVRPGDVIVKIDNAPVDSPSDAAAKIREAKHDKKEAVALVVMRDRTPYYLALQLATS